VKEEQFVFDVSYSYIVPSGRHGVGFFSYFLVQALGIGSKSLCLSVTYVNCKIPTLFFS
jgi:hypothetical protein